MRRRLVPILIGGVTVTLALAAALLLNRRHGAAAIVKRRKRAHAATDDVSLARKVETHIFRPHDAPKGDVSVDVEAGIVYLRGVADEQWRTRFGEEAAKVPGVTGVRNLLHAFGTPTPPAPPRRAMTDRD
jgi:osmotically-inducible protein OsmY